MNSHEEQAVKILQAWHRVEFFQTYSVPNKEDGRIAPVNIGIKELESAGDNILPWLTPKNQSQVGLDASKKITYTLYLGLFDKAVLTRIAEKHCNPETLDGICKEEIEQRLDSEGWSCFAKLQLDEDGAPLFDTFSVSTLPWAIGHLLKGQIDDISLAKLDRDSDQLRDTISRIGSEWPESPSNPEKRVLDANTIKERVQCLYDWAGLRPGDLARSGETPEFLFQIAFYQTEKASNKKKEEDSFENAQEEDEDLEKEAFQIPILNSFYIRDIERAINCIAAGNAGESLLQYLGTPGKRYPDLYGDNALALIEDRLSPDQTPEGRWPSNPEQNMSLMQQFAVNTVFKELKEGGLLSVNGPPGTGKTTLLRDIISQNLVERAKVLAGLKNARTGLTGKGMLIAPLTGFEMVVASSNNAAVENISKELPQIKSIAEDYDACRYFQPVANQLLAKKQKGRLQPIQDDSARAWGMISAVMGAKKKRNDFAARLFFYKHWGKEPPLEREPKSNFLNLWELRKQYAGPSFDQAKNAFNDALKDFKALNNEVAEFESISRSFNLETCLSQIAAAENEIAVTLTARLVIQDRLTELAGKLKALETEFSAEEISLEKIGLEPPGFFTRLFNLAENKRYKKARLHQRGILERLKREINNANKAFFSAERDLKLNRDNQSRLTDEMGRVKFEMEQKQARLNQLSSLLEGCRRPGADQQICDPKVQRDAFWQIQKVNDLRSKVFIAAMQLHEAWLMEVMDIASFRNNIFKLNDVVGGKEIKGFSTLALWQILFMFVPVISTTFASLGRMFTHINGKELGWLLIDEAGQAVPQAAIGGLMRTKRTLVVGDPLQIEPVFTSPPGLVQELMASLLGEEQREWSPNFRSVQQLADRMNPYGCTLNVMAEEMWIGIPLWVHRRCIDPMFAISNEIAYDNRMIHGNADNDNVPVKKHGQLGENRWIDSLGSCVTKQYKRELGEDTLKILLKAAKGNKSLEEIYIITPFKAVKNELKAFLSKNKDGLLKVASWEEKRLRIFLKENIGTIHTFQGKENDTVILVLGCDTENTGGAVWAAAKPNLLNVAVTRAKNHLFIVGDPRVWSDKTYFDKVYQALPN